MSTQEHDTRCVLCPAGQREPGATSVTPTRGEATIVFRGVPAQVCDACGEAYPAEAMARDLEQLADGAILSGVEYEIRDYVRKVA